VEIVDRQNLTVGDMRVLCAENVAQLGSTYGGYITALACGIPPTKFTEILQKPVATKLSVKQFVATMGKAPEQGVESPEVANMESTIPPRVSAQRVVPGEKFEFGITNLVDINRRYRLEFMIKNGQTVIGSNESVAVVVDGKRDSCITIPVRPENWPGAAWYASWKGSIKYRIFSYSRGPNAGFGVRVHLFNQNGYTRAASYTIFGDGAYNISADQTLNLDLSGSSPALEESYPLTETTHFLDVSVPFHNIYNWLHASDYRSKLILNFDSSDNTQIVVYSCAGDDFAFGNYIGCPATGLTGPLFTNKSSAALNPILAINGMMVAKENFVSS
jgi:hypothetical protein